MKKTKWYKKIRIHLLVVALTAICMVLSYSLWGNIGVELAFEAQVEKPARFQVYYTTESGERLSPANLQSIEISPGESRLYKLFLPAGNVYKFRMVMGNLNQPQTMMLKNLSFGGEETILVSDFKSSFKLHSCESVEYCCNEMKVSVLGSQCPHILYKGDLSLPGKIRVKWLVFISLLLIYYCCSWKVARWLAYFKTVEKSSRLDIVLISACAVLLFLPMSFISDATQSQTEKRKLAEKPALEKMFDKDYRYGAKFDAWFNDHFWGRDELMCLYNNVSEKLVTNGNKSVLRGHDDWLFVRNSGCLEDYMNMHPITDAQLSAAADYLCEIDEWCKENGKLFFYFCAPEKHHVYEEHFRLVRKLRPNSESIVARFMRTLVPRHLNAVSPIPNLLEAKKKAGALYYKLDSHWNPVGGYVGYSALMSKINEYSMYEVDKPTFVTLRDHPEKDQKKYPIWKTDDLVGLWPNAPDDRAVEYRAPVLKSDLIYAGMPVTDKTKEKHVTIVKNKRKKGKLVVFRDSFAVAMAPYLNETFGEVVYIWRYNVIPQDIEHLRDADIVLLENVARRIPNLVGLKFPTLK